MVRDQDWVKRVKEKGQRKFFWWKWKDFNVDIWTLSDRFQRDIYVFICYLGGKRDTMRFVKKNRQYPMLCFRVRQSQVCTVSYLTSPALSFLIFKVRIWISPSPEFLLSIKGKCDNVYEMHTASSLHGEQWLQL